MSNAATKTARYIGPMRQIEVEQGDFRATVEHGKPEKFPVEIADRLAEQADWEIVGGATSTGPTKDDLLEEAKGLGLDGVSKLTKPKLEQAIADHKAAAAAADERENALHPAGSEDEANASAEGGEDNDPPATPAEKE